MAWIMEHAVEATVICSEPACHCEQHVYTCREVISVILAALNTLA